MPFGPSSDTPWWKRTTTYQIYPRSFADSNGDGIGDLRGIIQKLDYLEWLGVETLWLSPFWKSPQADFGYDASDHFDVAPEYGTMDDCRELFARVHERGMKIVVDMVLNHTSDQHPWFLESRLSRKSARRDWYIWRDGKKPYGKAPPNNWRSMIGGSGWHWDPATDQWYFASFLPCQPDLDYRNPLVKAAMLDVVRYWLREGADGLRLDIFNAIFKDPSFEDNPFSWRPLPTGDNPHGFFQHHVHTIDHPDTIAFARELRTVVDEFDDPPRFLVGEVFGQPEALKQYCGEVADGLHLVFLFETLNTRMKAKPVRTLIDRFERAFPEPFSPTYVYGNHDRPRFIQRLGHDRAKAKLAAALQLTVRGVPFIYYGEEIGLPNHDIPLREGLDPIASRFRFVPQPIARGLRQLGILLNRDECRSPMQWNDGPNAGFSTEGATPWLPVQRSPNVAEQEHDPESLLSCYRNLLALRRELRALADGSLTFIDLPKLADELVAYRREAANGEHADVYLSFSSRRVRLDVKHHRDRRLFSNARGERITIVDPSYELAPWEAIVVFDPPKTSAPT